MKVGVKVYHFERCLAQLVGGLPEQLEAAGRRRVAGQSALQLRRHLHLLARRQRRCNIHKHTVTHPPGHSQPTAVASTHRPRCTHLLNPS